MIWISYVSEYTFQYHHKPVERIMSNMPAYRIRPFIQPDWDGYSMLTSYRKVVGYNATITLREDT